jgi:rhodanese-related sulfurtransferase
MTEQVVLYALLGLVLLLFVRKKLLARTIKQYSPREVHELMHSGRSPLILDVRSNREWSTGHLKGAVHIPLHELQRRIDELEKHKGREIVCYCQTGSRSVSAAIRLKRQGFTASNMRGGLGEWNFEGLT